MTASKGIPGGLEKGEDVTATRQMAARTKTNENCILMLVLVLEAWKDWIHTTEDGREEGYI